MEGHINFSFTPEELKSYEDLIQNTGWPADTNQHQQQFFTQPNQAPYSQYTATQSTPAHGHGYNINHQQSYTPVSYSTSPYAAAAAAQYQHARPSDVFGPTSYNVEPSLQGPTYHGHDSSFSFTPQPSGNATISPQSLQYGMNQNQTLIQNQALIRSVPNPAFQRSSNGIGNAFHQRPQDPSNMYFQSTQNPQNGNILPNQVNNVSYPVLPKENPQAETVPYIPKQELDPVPIAQAAQVAPAARPQQIPPPPPLNPLRTTHPELLDGSDTSAQIRLDYAPYLAFEDTPIQVNLTLKNTLPKYQARKSRSGKDLVPGYDISTSLTPARVSTKRSRPPKESRSTENKYKGTSQSSRSLVSKAGSLPVEDQLTSTKGPSSPSETSSSEDESGSSEESEYEEDEMPVVDIKEIRGEMRPTTIPEATRYDAIGIIWKDPNSQPNGEVVRDALERFASFFSTQRVAIKTNSTKMEEAAPGSAELQRLRDERAILLESLYQTIDVANKLGHPPIVENLGGHHKLVNGLTTTLIECSKANDFLGKLPKAIFSLLAKFQTMTDELLQKLKFDGIQKRWSKRGDEDTKKDIASILANTTNAKEKAAKAKKASEEAEKEKKLREKLEQNKSARAAENVPSQATNPAKRPHEGDGPNGMPSKKVAINSSGINNLSSKPIPAKRIGNNLLGITSKPAPKPIPKKREPSPPTESRLGALLASIAKPPEAPKVAEAPPRAPETPEEKARRERKESRRHLRVKFKEGSELEEIKLFKHEQAEDEGRQDEMVRDAHEHRLEGMMHKKRRLEMFDEDDDYQPSEPDIPYSDLLAINFANANKSTPLGEIYNTRGGSRTFTTPEQETQRQREAVELMVIYTVPSDMPPTPKELSHAEISQMDGTDDYQPEVILKSPTEPWLAQRLNELHQYGPEVARQVFNHRQPPQQWGHQKASTGASISHTFGGPIQQGTVPQMQTSQNPPDMDPIAYANLVRIVNSVKGKPYPPREPPDHMTNQADRDEWTEGLLRDMAAKEQAEASQRLAQVQATQQPPQMLPQHYIQQPPQMSYPPPVQQPGIPAIPQNLESTQHLQSYLAGVQLGDNRAGQFDYSSWMGNAANPQNETNVYSNPSHVQGQNQNQARWEANWGNENTKPSRSHEKKQRGGHNAKPGGNNNSSIFDERGEYKGKKKPCRFYQDGKCAKGAACTYLHDE